MQDLIMQFAGLGGWEWVIILGVVVPIIVGAIVGIRKLVRSQGGARAAAVVLGVLAFISVLGYLIWQQQVQMEQQRIEAYFQDQERQRQFELERQRQLEQSNRDPTIGDIIDQLLGGR